MRSNDLNEHLVQPVNFKTEQQAHEDDPTSPSQILVHLLDRNLSPSDQPRHSIESSALEFEEAVNTEISVPANSPGVKTPVKSALLLDKTPTSSETLNPLQAQSSVVGVAKPVYDIDSLNEFKKSTDLASKKVEITNQIFEMLVNEIKESLFPMRDEDEEYEEDISGQPDLTAKAKSKKKKKKRARRVKKPSVLPKIKEIKYGAPIDMCLKRIQIQAKMRKSIASVELFDSLSATQSLSMSKDTGVSYLDQTKSKE